MAFDFADVIVCLYLMEVRESDSRFIALRWMERFVSRFIACGSASLEGVIWVIGDEFLR